MGGSLYDHPELYDLIVEQLAPSEQVPFNVSRARPGEPDFLVVPLHLRNIFPEELPRILGDGGLRIELRFGDFNGAPFRGDSEHQVCVCRAVDR
jgi:hypothetical protein